MNNLIHLLNITSYIFIIILTSFCSSEEIISEAKPLAQPRKTEIFEKVKDRNNNYIKKNLNDSFVVLSEDNQILTAEYDSIQDFDGGYIVKVDGKYGLLSSKAVTLQKPKYSNLELITEGIYKYENLEKWGLLSASKIITNATFDDIQIFQEKILKVSLKNKLGLIDFLGNKIIPTEFDTIEPYKENFLLVSKNRDMGLFNSSGKIIIPISFDEIKEFNENLMLVNLNGDFGLYNFSGTEILPPKFQSIEPREDEFIVIQKKGKYGVLDKEGKAISKVNLQAIGQYKESFLGVKVNNFWGLLDKKGKYFLEPKYDNEIYVENYNNKFYKLVISEYVNYGDSENDRMIEKNGVVDLNGNLIIPPYYNSLDFEDIGKDVYRMRESGASEGETLVGILNMILKAYLKPAYSSLSYLGDGYFRTEYINYNNNNDDNRKYGIININSNPMKIISDPVYSEIEYVNNNLFLVCNDFLKCGIINNNSEVILNLAYENFMYNFNDNELTPVKLNEKWGYVDKAGKLKIFNKYEDASVFQNGVASVRNNNKWGFIDKKGKVIIRLKYDGVGSKYGNYYEVSINNLWGLIDTNGKPYIEIENDNIDVYESEDLVVINKDKLSSVLRLSDLKVLAKDIQEVQAFISGRAIYKEVTSEGNEIFGIINKSGQFTLKAKYSNLKYINNDLYAFQRDEKWGILNNEGKIILKPTYTDILGFYDNFSVVCIDDKYGLIDTSGKVKFSVEYPLIESFSNQKALVKEKESESCFIIDIKLKRLNDYCSLSNERRFIDGFILDSAASRGGR